MTGITIRRAAARLQLPYAQTGDMSMYWRHSATTLRPNYWDFKSTFTAVWLDPVEEPNMFLLSHFLGVKNRSIVVSFFFPEAPNYTE